MVNPFGDREVREVHAEVLEDLNRKTPHNEPMSTANDRLHGTGDENGSNCLERRQSRSKSPDVGRLRRKIFDADGWVVSRPETDGKSRRIVDHFFPDAASRSVSTFDRPRQHRRYPGPSRRLEDVLDSAATR